jgi:hypothetical protein
LVEAISEADSLWTGWKIAGTRSCNSAIDAGRGDRLIGDKQDDRIRAAPPRLLGEADVADDAEELLEWPVTDIDDRGARGVGQQPVEQFHLSADFADIDRPDQFGEAAGQRGLARIEVVTDQWAAVVEEKFHQQPRQQGLAHARMRRRDDVERRRLEGHCRS